MDDLKAATRPFLDWYGIFASHRKEEADGRIWSQEPPTGVRLAIEPPGTPPKKVEAVGIKIHPESHKYPIAEHGDPVFEFAAKHRTVVLAHSGDINSVPDDYVIFADRYPEAKIILAHLGNGGAAAGSPELQVRALQCAKGDNLLIDTSSARSILPGLLEWAVKEVGVDRILYGTDTPVYYAPMQWARVVCTDLSAEEKGKILRENAFVLFDLQSCL